MRAAVALKNPNWLGLPLIPKFLCSPLPYSRAAYNSFIVWIKNLSLDSAKTIVDVGANHGDFSKAASTCYPETSIFLIEPLPKLQRSLQKWTQRRNDKWRLITCALGAEAGRLPLFVDENHDDIGSLAGFSEDYLKANPRARASQQLVCDVKPLDQLAMELDIDQIDILKVDVEGYEFEVIAGAKRILEKTSAIIVEVSLVRMARPESPLAEMLRVLTNRGFEVVNIFPSLIGSDERWRPQEFNVLARRREL